MSHEFDLSHATMLPALGERTSAIPEPEELAARWEAVHEAAAAVAVLAQLGEEAVSEETRALPERAMRLDGERYALIARGIEDLAAVMRPGLRALIAADESGGDSTSAALTLWREFHRARDAIEALAPAS
jgi:maltooligosyltrehalose synthase